MDAAPAAALIGALALLLVPGGVLAHVLGFRGLWWLAVAPVVSVAVIGSVGVVAAPLRIPFAWWEPPVVALVAAGVILGVRGLRRRRLLRPRIGRWTRSDVVVFAVVALSAAVAAVVVVAGFGSWSNISQTYDGVFHLNAVAWIQSTGDASSFDLYRITHPGTGNEFYPAAWHAIVVSTVQATGATIPVATNAVWIAMQSLVWMPGAALLAAVIAPARRRMLAGCVAAVAGIGLIGFPTLLVAWGTLYPTALAYALLPIGLALTVRLMRWVVVLPLDGRRPFPGALVAAFALWIIASSFAHPRSLFGWIVLAAPLVVIEGGRTVGRLWRRPRARRPLVVVLGSLALAIVAVVGVGAFYVYRTFDLAHRPISDHLNGGPATATQGLLASLGQAIGLAPPQPNDPGVLPVAWILAITVLAGAVIALGRSRTRWIVIAWVLAILFYVLAAGSNSDLAKVLTGVWYKDKFRLFALLPVLQAPLIALVVVEASLRLQGRARAVLTAAVAAVVVAGVATSNTVLAGPALVSTAFSLPAHEKKGKLLDGDEQRLLERLPQLVPAGDVVAGDPWDGSTLSWALGDRRALFPHLAGEWSPDQLLVASSLQDITTNPAVCAAVHRLGVRYVVEDPELLWGQPKDAAPFVGFHLAVRRGVLIPVARVGSAGLYRVPDCTG
ncbi:DUF6541 family protein [Pseudolysinimonas sp.]|uniref:DUF6541 family protein n=1 Tax=Pseudolysinimonas sp. TaxID=2680009 RepID=UPI003F814A18